jgi:RNA polymerase sigma-70 factor, ECF subfamily
MKILSNEVIALLNKKQEAAFEVAFNLYYPRLVYFAKEYISDEDAKNAVQDAFITFWEKKPQLLSEYQLQSYLYTTVKNNCLMLLRHEKVKKNYEANKQIKIQNLLYTSALGTIGHIGNHFSGDRGNYCKDFVRIARPLSRDFCFKPVRGEEEPRNCQ